jgi:endonuclease YncB( thermonuclease family)
MWVALAAAAALNCTPVATDGDTFRCGDERIRLLGIDAPEMAGRCREGRRCVPGNADASKASLTRALKAKPLQIDRVGTDRYGRTLATVQAGGRNLSCHQMAARAAVYIRKWDNGKRIAKTCPDLAREPLAAAR